jgi:hypothetical protein
MPYFTPSPVLERSTAFADFSPRPTQPSPTPSATSVAVFAPTPTPTPSMPFAPNNGLFQLSTQNLQFAWDKPHTLRLFTQDNAKLCGGEQEFVLIEEMQFSPLSTLPPATCTPSPTQPTSTAFPTDYQWVTEFQSPDGQYQLIVTYQTFLVIPENLNPNHAPHWFGYSREALLQFTDSYFLCNYSA